MSGPTDFDMASKAGERASREAATWFALLLDDNTPEADHIRFREWLDADMRNAQAYARLERLWAAAGSDTVHAPQDTSRRNLLKATSAVILLTGGGLTAWTVMNRADHSTGTGELRTITLEDGSQVELSAASAISVDFTSSARRVRLHEGEAYFSVAGNDARPFTVIAGEVNATALGTAYSVSITSERTSVAVARHQVRVQAGGQRVDLDEGDVIDWENGKLSTVGTNQAEERMAWRSRQLVFLARPLGEVIDAVNRWRTGHLILRDKALAQRRVTVVVDLKDIEGIDLTLEQGLPITLTSYTPLVTLVSARK
jgi:transmembrane sensor